MGNLLKYIKLLSRTTVDLLLINGGTRFRRQIISAIYKLIKFIPTNWLRKITPQRFKLFISSFFMSEALGTNRLDLLLLIKDAQKCPESFVIATQQELTFLFVNNMDDELMSQIRNRILNNNGDISLDEPVLGWAFWNLNHNLYSITIKEYIDKVLRLTEGELWSNNRILENYTQFLGHLGELCTYINFYKETERKIQLPSVEIANSYLLEKIIDHSPLPISFLPKDFCRANLEIGRFDQLTHSFQDSRKIRLESNMSFLSNQVHPEFEFDSSFRLALSDKEVLVGKEILEDLIPNIGEKWINVLHIRGTDVKSSITSQTRDASILDYLEYCGKINDLGGIVIRMGDSSFPNLIDTFPAFDYANSKIKSEFMDCWFWNACKWWTGNSNGAAAVAMAFGKPRLMTNMWHWNLVGNSSDIVIPKTLSKNEKVLNPSQTIHSRIGRSQSRKEIYKNGYILHDNSSSQLVAGVEEMYQSLEFESLWKSPVTPIENEFREALGVKPQKSIMRLSPSFLESYEADIN